MKRIPIAGALALGLSLMSVAALADDPHDPLLSRSAKARARDREAIRQLNLRELDYVQRRDAHYSDGWKAWRDARDRKGRYSERSERAQDDYVRARQRYERDMAEWRRAVAACRAGDYDACGG